jgi:hypothetical protein
MLMKQSFQITITIIHYLERTNLNDVSFVKLQCWDDKEMKKGDGVLLRYLST